MWGKSQEPELDYSSDCPVPDVAAYFNSGVLTIDLDRWHSTDVESRIFDFASTLPASYILPDQDALDTVLWSDWLPLAWKQWNWPGYFPGPARLRDPRRPLQGSDQALDRRSPWSAILSRVPQSRLQGWSESASTTLPNQVRNTRGDPSLFCCPSASKDRQGCSRQASLEQLAATGRLLSAVYDRAAYHVMAIDSLTMPLLYRVSENLLDTLHMRGVEPEKRLSRLQVQRWVLGVQTGVEAGDQPCYRVW